MKTSTYWLASGVAAVALGLGFAGTAFAVPTSPASPSATAAQVDASVAPQLTFLREEERLARDVYTAIAARYPANASHFTQVAAAEQRHFESMGALLTRYGLADPSAGRAAGSYADPALSTLYQKLMVQSRLSVKDAYQVGIAIEQSDLSDLKKGLNSALPTDVAQVFTRLQTASNNHLAAFTALRNGTTPTRSAAGMGQGPRATSTAASQATATPSPGAGAQYGQGRGHGTQAGTSTGAGTGRNANPDCPLR